MLYRAEEDWENDATGFSWENTPVFESDAPPEREPENLVVEVPYEEPVFLPPEPVVEEHRWIPEYEPEPVYPTYEAPPVVEEDWWTPEPEPAPAPFVWTPPPPPTLTELFDPPTRGKVELSDPVWPVVSPWEMPSFPGIIEPSPVPQLPPVIEERTPFIDTPRPIDPPSVWLGNVPFVDDAPPSIEGPIERASDPPIEETFTFSVPAPSPVRPMFIPAPVARDVDVPSDPPATFAQLAALDFNPTPIEEQVADLIADVVTPAPVALVSAIAAVTLPTPAPVAPPVFTMASTTLGPDALAQAAQVILDRVRKIPGAGRSPITLEMQRAKGSVPVVDTVYGGFRYDDYYHANPVPDPSGLILWDGADSWLPMPGLSQAEMLAAQVLTSGGDAWSADFHPVNALQYLSPQNANPAALAGVDPGAKPSVQISESERMRILAAEAAPSELVNLFAPSAPQGAYEGTTVRTIEISPVSFVPGDFARAVDPLTASVAPAATSSANAAPAAAANVATQRSRWVVLAAVVALAVWLFR